MRNQEMDENQAMSDTELLRLTADMVASYLSHNEVEPDRLSEVIAQVHETLKSLAGAGKTVAVEPLRPAVSVKKSITREYLICLEDGKRLKMLKRYLSSNYNMTPEQYRTKWGLSPNYPMVAPAYAEQRSEFAKRIGLGRVGAANKKPVSRGGKRSTRFLSGHTDGNSRG